MSCEEKKTTMTASLRRREGEGVVGSFDIPYGKFLRDKSLVPCGKRRVVGRPGVHCMSLFIRNVVGDGEGLKNTRGRVCFRGRRCEKTTEYFPSFSSKRGYYEYSRKFFSRRTYCIPLFPSRSRMEGTSICFSRESLWNFARAATKGEISVGRECGKRSVIIIQKTEKDDDDQRGSIRFPSITRGAIGDERILWSLCVWAREEWAIYPLKKRDGG